MWISHPDFQELVQSNWGTKQFCICRKLKRIESPPLKQLNSKHIAHISTRADNAKRGLITAQNMRHDKPSNAELQNTVGQLRKQAVFLSESERNFFFQQAKLSQEQAAALVREISSHEIKEALFDIGEDKSLGPIGYTSCFFKKAWHTIGEDFCVAIKEFFTSSLLLKQINHMIIALIPKSGHATTVGDYRPIACCNVIYKVIAKILASRLALILDNLVDQAQSAVC
ncbi:Uncharacterized protein Adt_40565 [Abeliophyllum distichum]|uniref:Reverse transcriptase n=1 Tax=Abeliophyllum distichum TaxID=126358 RepID=A0ABD1Q890_9LAMI